jgi:hypothetical protein
MLARKPFKFEHLELVSSKCLESFQTKRQVEVM